MNSRKSLFIFLCLALPLISINLGCKTAKSSAEKKLQADGITKSDDIASLVKLMTGSFSSAGQATEDSTYYDISLQMYPIWTGKQAHYLYVEQAVSANPSKPYRQRVYKLVKDDNGGFESQVFTISDEESFVGKWETPEYFESFDESILKEKEGCTVYLIQHADGSFSGSTRMDHCKSTLRGASYATSIVKIRKDNIMSWDQGFDAEGKQVWGAEKGGYVFERLSTTN